MGKWHPDTIEHDYGVDSINLVRRHNNDVDGYQIQINLITAERDRLATDYAALEAERDEWKRRCEAKERLESAGYTEDEQGRAFDLNAVKCPYCGDSTPLTEEGGCPEEVIRNFDWPSGNAECRNCDKTFYYEIEGCAITDSMTMEYDGTPIAEGRDNG